MKRVGVVMSLSLLALAACDQPPPKAPELPPGVKVVSRDRLQVPLEDRPVFGKVGDTTCATPNNELLLAMEGQGCLSLQTDTIKPDTAAAEGADVQLARLRAVYFQPGPQLKGKTVGWELYATRTNCDTQEVWVMGHVTYDPEGFELSRATPQGGPLPLPVGLVIANLIAAVCPT